MRDAEIKSSVDTGMRRRFRIDCPLRRPVRKRAIHSRPRREEASEYAAAVDLCGVPPRHLGNVSANGDG